MKRLAPLAVLFLNCVALAAQTPTNDPADGAAARGIDQKIPQISVQGAQIADALAEIGRQANVKIVVDEASLELLPWGRETKLADVTATEASLREILPQVLGPIGLTYEIRSGEVQVMATEPLKRMCRRATWEDLKLLQQAAALEYTPENFKQFKLQFRITSKVDAATMLENQLAKAGRGSIAEMLEVATGSLGWVWFPDGDHFVIRTQQAQIANRMARRVTVRYANTPLARILIDLSEKAETQFVLEPGMMLKLPPNTVQSYTLLLQSASIRQALELICAETGLKYEIDREVVKIGISDALAEGGKGAGQRNTPYVGKIAVPSADGSYTLEFLIRADELPPDILDARNQMIEEIIQKMRKDMGTGSTMPSPDAPDQ